MSEDVKQETETRAPYHYTYKQKISVDPAKLTSARLAAQMSMKEVAAELKCNIGSVCKWERGRLIPSAERILKMVTLFKCGDFVVEGAKK